MFGDRLAEQDYFISVIEESPVESSHLERSLAPHRQLDETPCLLWFGA